MAAPMLEHLASEMTHGKALYNGASMPAASIPLDVGFFRLPLATLLLLAACGSEPPAIGARESNSPDAPPRPAAGAISAPVPEEIKTPFPAEARIIGLSSGSANGGGAIVALGDRQRYVPAGGRLLPGWTLAAVEPAAAVFVDVNGAERRLAIPEESITSAETDLRSTAAPGDVARMGMQLRLETSEARSAEGKLGRRFESDPPPALVRGGVRRGDILISYDGESFDRGEDIDDLVYILQTRGSVPLVIERDGRRLELNVRR